MFKIPSLTPRQYLIVAHDLIATAVAILASFFIRFEEIGLAERLDGLIRFLPGFVVYAGFVYFLFGLHASKWRFFSLPDVFNIVKAATVLAISLLVLHHVANTAAALAAIRGLLRPSGRIALADLDTEDGTFHDAHSEGIHHLGFDRNVLGDLARAAGFVDVEFLTAIEIVEGERRFPVFLLLGRNP